MSGTKRVVILACVLMATVLSGCNVTPDRSPKVSPDWSRGLHLGNGYLNQPVAMAVDETQTVHLVWCGWGEGGASRLHYVTLDRQGRVQSDRDLDIPVVHPRRPQLLYDEAGQLHLAWVARAEDDEEDSLFHAVLTSDGTVSLGPQRLSPAGQEVNRFQLYRDAAGRAALVWANVAETNPGLYHLTLAQEGTPLAPAVLIVPNGHVPTVQVDNEGTLHLMWLEKITFSLEGLYYAAFPHSQVASTTGTMLTQLVVEQGLILDGPALGLDETHVYVFWSLERRGGGLQGPSAEAWYLSFPIGHPDEGKARKIDLPGTSQPEYTTYAGVFNYTRLHPLDPRRPVYGSDFVYMPAVVPGQRAELPVLLIVMISTRTKSRPQPVMTVFDAGEIKGYQLLALTDALSTQPNVVADNESHLHATWSDLAGAWDFEIYYATTAPSAAAWLNRTSLEDVLNGAFTLMLGMLSGIGFIPWVGVAILPALIWVSIYYALTGEDDLSWRKPQIGLGTGALVYLMSKLLLLSPLLVYLPGLEQLPEQWQSRLILIVPMLILGIALGAVYVYRRRAERATLFPAFFVLILTDVLLTLVVYSPSVLRE